MNNPISIITILISTSRDIVYFFTYFERIRVIIGENKVIIEGITTPKNARPVKKDTYATKKLKRPDVETSKKSLVINT